MNACAVVENDGRWFRRCSTGPRGGYVCLPLCVPAKWRDRMQSVYGDAQLFERNGDGYVMLPWRIGHDAPPVCDGEPTFSGVDLGIVRWGTVRTSGAVECFAGKAVRHRREHVADLRRRYPKHNRLDRVKGMGGQERRWMRDSNHQMSRRIVDLAATYERPVMVFETLNRIRSRVGGSQHFHRRMSSWAFRQWIDLVTYKAARAGIPVVSVDPRGTSKACSRCGHSWRSNRPDHSHVRCVSCGYQLNADPNAARNIAALGLDALPQGPSDTAQSNDQTGEVILRPDGASGDTLSVSSNSNRSSSL